jgi:D-aspartate ligase
MSLPVGRQTTTSADRGPVPAVVVEGTLNALGVVRSLARGGMPIYLVDSDPRCTARFSRHCRYVQVPVSEGSALADALVQLGHRLACRPVLILTGDRSVNCVSDYREQIEPLYRISLPCRKMVRALADKALFQGLAEREGVAVVPRAAIVSDTTHLVRLEKLQPPVVIKPTDKTLVLKGEVQRAVRANTLVEARHAAAQMLPRAGTVIVQEWIPGPDSELYFALFSCDSQGRPAGLFVGRKLACSPPSIGNTALCIAAPEAAQELVTATLQFIERVGYRGLGSLEFKRHADTGRFVVIEPTVGRTDWQEELATLCGVNLPLLTYLSELGEPPSLVPEVSAKLAWRQSAGFAAPLPPGTRVVDGYFRWSDPLPGLYYYVLKCGVLRVWNRLCVMAGLIRSSVPRRTNAQRFKA